jgi:hypothetical protein
MRWGNAMSSRSTFEITGNRAHYGVVLQCVKTSSWDERHACRRSSEFNMTAHSSTTTRIFQLQRAQSLRLRGAHQVRAVHGTLWLTLDGVREDVVIEAGQSHHIDGRRPALLTALEGSAQLVATPLQSAQSATATRVNAVWQVANRRWTAWLARRTGRWVTV